MKHIPAKIRQLEEGAQYRALQPASGIDFSSNDYLGFAAHPALREAAHKFIDSGESLGSGGSRLLRGNHPAHKSLEIYAADYFGSERALFFSSGYQANAAIFQSLPARGDVIIFDSLIHASAREAIQASPARRIRAAHNDLQAYEDALKKHRDSAGHIWIAVESVYSMDGDCAPLAELQKLAQEYGATLIVDEAHGTGVFGDNGKGLSEGLPHNNIITMHTCGKALGVAGGLVCAPAPVIDWMINTARPFIYSTAPMPLQAYLVQQSLELLQSAEGQAQRTKLLDLMLHARSKAQHMQGWLLHRVPSPIMPYIVGESAPAMALADAMQAQGYDIRAVRPPTVPKGSARLRISLSANLDIGDFDAMFDSLEKEALS